MVIGKEVREVVQNHTLLTEVPLATPMTCTVPITCTAVFRATHPDEGGLLWT